MDFREKGPESQAGWAVMASGMGQVGGVHGHGPASCPPLSFTAESGDARQNWAAALQEAVTETLSDYEVAEKIWSNRANRHCADCGASRPDWAAVNLGVVICKQCAGEGGCKLAGGLPADQRQWGTT